MTKCHSIRKFVEEILSWVGPKISKALPKSKILPFRTMFDLPEENGLVSNPYSFQKFRPEF